MHGGLFVKEVKKRKPVQCPQQQLFSILKRNVNRKDSFIIGFDKAC